MSCLSSWKPVSKPLRTQFHHQNHDIHSNDCHFRFNTKPDSMNPSVQEIQSASSNCHSVCGGFQENPVRSSSLEDSTSSLEDSTSSLEDSTSSLDGNTFSLKDRASDSIQSSLQNSFRQESKQSELSRPPLNPAGWFEEILDEDFKNPPQNNTCIAGISGGPDSMALLELLVHYDWRPTVCHVNYHKRDTAKRDEQIVRDYCKEHNLPFVLLEPEYTGGNFQGWARDVRMDFFEQEADRLGDVPIFLAHQKDDVIETYFLQKKRKILCDFFGIRKKTVKKKRTYWRPLLRLSKKDLIDFNAAHGILWGLDESNLSDHYLRNQIRHSQIERMDDLEKERWLKRIQQENQILEKRRQHALNQIENQKPGLWLLDEDAPFILEYWFYQKTGLHLSALQSKEIVRQLHKNVSIPIQNWILERFGDHLFLEKQENLEPEEITIHSFEELESMLNTPIHHGQFHFSLKNEGKTIESVYVTQEDFPLRLATAKDKDFIALRYGRKKVGRIFVDQKRPHIWRRSVLLIKNRADEVIFVPGTGCSVAHFSTNPSFYMVEF